MAGVVLGTVTPSVGAVEAAKRVQSLLCKQSGGGEKLSVLSVRDEATATPALELPDECSRIVRWALDALARGHSLELVRVDEEWTPKQAAERLGVSRPFVTKLLVRGEIPHHRVGTHWRVYRTDVEAYRERKREEARRSLRELVKR